MAKNAKINCTIKIHLLFVFKVILKHFINNIEKTATPNGTIISIKNNLRNEILNVIFFIKLQLKTYNTILLTIHAYAMY